jgi:tRNA-Thr(GGU) m(6)t(6)A37 methyltransferase TsaA
MSHGERAELCCRPIGFVKRSRDSGDLDELRRELAQVVLQHDLCPALEGLKAGSIVWVIWYAHVQPKEKPLVVRPRRDPSRRPRGVFATRSPVRPCPIGLSLTRVVSVDGCTLVLVGLDAIDGTPVLDIKPYSESLDAPSAIPSASGEDRDHDST